MAAAREPKEIDRSVSAVERTAAILNAFLLEKRALSLSDLEARTGLFKSVILRYMITLTRENLIKKLENGDYHLGTKVLSLATLYEQSLDYSQIIGRSLEKLVQLTSETASFYIREGDTRICLFRRNSPRSLQVNVRPGDTVPLDETSTGQVLRDADAEPQKNGDYVRQSAGLIDSMTTSISAPIFDYREKLVGALTLSGPIGRFQPSDPLVRAILITEVKEVSTILGSTAKYQSASADHR